MKNTILALVFVLAGCGSKEAAPAPVPAPTPTVTGQFAATTGSFVITPAGAPAYTLSNLKLKMEAIEAAGGASATTYYTWRGLTPSNTGVEIEAAYTYRSGAATALPWTVNVITRTADANFTQVKTLDLTGGGTLTAANKGVALTYTGKAVSGKLTQ